MAGLLALAAAWFGQHKLAPVYLPVHVQDMQSQTIWETSVDCRDSMYSRLFRRSQGRWSQMRYPLGPPCRQ